MCMCVWCTLQPNKKADLISFDAIHVFSSSLVSFRCRNCDQKKSTLINYRDCKNVATSRIQCERGWMWTFLWICLNTLEILQRNARNFFSETESERCLTHSTTSTSTSICYIGLCSLYSDSPIFLCDGLLKRHSNKCGSMNRFIHAHTHCTKMFTNWTGKLVSINRMHACVRV